MNGWQRSAVLLTRWFLVIAVCGVILWRMLSTYGGGGYGDRWHRSGELPEVAPLLSGSTSPQDRAILDSLTIIVTSSPITDDGAFTADVSINNRSSVTVKDVVIDCDGLGASGAHIGQTRAVLTTPVRPHHSNTTARFTLPFLQRNVTTASCTASGFHPI